MKNALLLLCLFALLPRLATAQEARTAVSAERVTYSRAVPKALRTFVPRGGKSRFWGATKFKYNGQQVWVHVYDVQKTIFPKSEGNTDGVQKSGLDLFVLSKLGELKRVSSTPFKYSRWGNHNRGGDFETVSVKTLWLDYKIRRRPILHIEVEDPNGFVGPIASGILFVFEQGFKKVVVQNNFGYGNDNSGGFNSWDTSFVTNQKGELNVIFTYNSTSGGLRTIYRWENNRFKPFEKLQRQLNKDKYVPVPLTPAPNSGNL